MIVCILVFSSIQTLPATQQNQKATATNPPPEILNLMEDTILYFTAPKDAQITIEYTHRYGEGNALFDFYNNCGDHTNQLVFSNEEDATSKTTTLQETSTYKLVATGTAYHYNLRFEGPNFDYRIVILALPHKGIFRVTNAQQSTIYFPVNTSSFTVYATNEYHPTNPARRGSVKIYNPNQESQATLTIPCYTLPESFQQEESITDAPAGFWKAEFSGLDAGQARIGFWTNQSTYEYSTGLAVLLTPSPEYYFVPDFMSRNISLSFTQTDQIAHLGAASHPGVHEYTDFYQQYTEPLHLSTYNFYIDWFWREETSGSNQNDDADPYHINWEGFDFGPYDEKFEFFNTLNISPILNLQWSSNCFVENPSYWQKEEMQEYAEFVLATLIHTIAPDLQDPPLQREPWNITAIQFFAEQNLLFEAELDREESLNQYLLILETIINRTRSHPDPRINQVDILTTGVTGGYYGESEKLYWTQGVLEYLGSDIDMVGWDQYLKWYLEELPGYGEDVEAMQALLDSYGSDATIAMPEFNVHGGVPTSQYFLGSNFNTLYCFGAIANSINAGMKHIMYFSLIDSSYEPRLKGLMTADAPMPPYSSLPGFSKKPQYYAMQILGEICQAPLLVPTSTNLHLDATGSCDGSTTRFGISNRYEAETTIQIPLEDESVVHYYEICDEGIIHMKDETALTIEYTIPAWTLLYVVLDGSVNSNQSDLDVQGSLSWSDVESLSSLSGQFSINNIGGSGSILNWSIAPVNVSWSSSDQWQFSWVEPSGGLTPENSPVIVSVNTSAPSEKQKSFSGYLKVYNTDNPSDYDVVAIHVSTQRQFSLFEMLVEKIHDFLEVIIEMFSPV